MDRTTAELKEDDLELTVSASREQIPTITQFIEDLMASFGFASKKRFEFQLAVEEACTNIAMYAYPRGDGSIRIKARFSNDRLELSISDSGAPFDPTTRTVAISAEDADHRPIGGLGIALIRASVDKISYEFKDGENILRLVKNRT